MTRTFSDGHPKVLPACNFLSQYYFYNIFLQKCCRFSLQTLTKFEAAKTGSGVGFLRLTAVCQRAPFCSRLPNQCGHPPHHWFDGFLPCSLLSYLSVQLFSSWRTSFFEVCSNAILQKLAIDSRRSWLDLIGCLLSRRLLGWSLTKQRANLLKTSYFQFQGMV